VVEVVTEIYDAAGRQVARDVAMQAIGKTSVLLWRVSSRYPIRFSGQMNTRTLQSCLAR
jgi:hypothetical protein